MNNICKRLISLVLFLAISALFSGCGKDDTSQVKSEELNRQDSKSENADKILLYNRDEQKILSYDKTTNSSSVKDPIENNFML
jgi:hypothetical protein